MQVLDPLHIGQNVKEVLECDLAAEISARTLYEEAATHCHGVKDDVSRDLFESLMSDEEGHIDFLETQLDLVAKIGVELYSQHHMGKLQATEPFVGQRSADRQTQRAITIPSVLFQKGILRAPLLTPLFRSE